MFLYIVAIFPGIAALRRLAANGIIRLVEKGTAHREAQSPGPG